MEGLQDICPIFDASRVTSAVSTPILAEARAASHPAWPPPMTRTSTDVSRSFSTIAWSLFHVEHHFPMQNLENT